MSAIAATQGANVELSGGELAAVITATATGALGLLKSIGWAGKWMLSSRVGREEWVDERVREVFKDIKDTAANLQVRVDALERDKARLSAVAQVLIFELARIDPTSPVLRRAAEVLDGNAEHMWDDPTAGYSSLNPNIPKPK